MTNYIEHIDKKRVEQLLKKDDLNDDVKSNWNLIYESLTTRKAVLW
jgi:hypothetical protein